MSRFYAHRVIEAAKVAENLLPIGNIPATESQARPLALEEDYCRARWGMSRPNAYRLIDAAKVVANLSPIGDIPATESQARRAAPLRTTAASGGE